MHISKNAFCIQGERLNRTTTSFGVYDDNGLVPNCEIETSPWVSRPEPKAQAPRSAQRIYGPTLFAGSADFQFGYVLMNALGRLSILPDLPPETTLFFAIKPMHGPNPMRTLPAVLRALGIRNPVVMSEFGTYFDELITTREQFGEYLGGCGTPAFYRWIDTCWKPAPLKIGSKVYLTRSQLGGRKGRFACEDHLEQLLAKEGYQIVAPEKLPLHEQISLYQSTERLIFAESSALHLYSLIRRPGQNAAVIQRRPELPKIMTAQMQDRIGDPPLAINVVDKTLWPSLRGNHLGISVLDFDRLGDELQNAGLIRGKGWHAPSGEKLKGSVDALFGPFQEPMTCTERAVWLQQMRAKRRNQQAA